MKCHELLRLLNDYVDGDIEIPACEDFEKHLEDCNPCQIVVDTIRKTITLYKGPPFKGEEAEPPQEFRFKLRAALKERWDQRHGGPAGAPQVAP